MKHITATLLALFLTSGIANANWVDDENKELETLKMQHDIKQIEDKQADEDIKKANFD